MLEIEGAQAGIIDELYIDSKNYTRQEIISFYDENQMCYGDFDISELEIYEVKNPYFLADTFIFCDKFKNSMIPYISVNSLSQIEEIGCDFSKRFHFDNYNELLKRDDVKKAEVIHKIIFSLISDEYWLLLANKKN